MYSVLTQTATSDGDAYTLSNPQSYLNTPSCLRASLYKGLLDPAFRVLTAPLATALTDAGGGFSFEGRDLQGGATVETCGNGETTTDKFCPGSYIA